MRNLIFPLLVCLILLNSGCHALRKKFIRKKRLQKETPVYVDFKDYPQKPSRDAYIDYYLFVRGWLDDLVKAVDKGTSQKRKKRSINEAIMNLEQIISFFNLQGKEKVYPFYEDLLAIREEIERNPHMSEIKINFLVRKIEHFKRRFEKDFNYTEAEKWMN